jgi:hypothetical protein
VWGFVGGLIGIGYTLTTAWLAFNLSFVAIVIYYDPTWKLVSMLVRSGMIDDIWIVIVAPMLHFVVGFVFGVIMASVKRASTRHTSQPSMDIGSA